MTDTEGLYARIEELERERDEARARVAALVEEAVNVLRMRDEGICPDNMEAFDRGWSRALKTAAPAIRDLATDEERDALAERDARIRAEEREACARRAEEAGQNLFRDLDDANDKITCEVVAAAIRDRSED